VQIGNPVEEKRALDAILACREAGLIRAITDCGAGGFSSAMGEMGESLGVAVDLERAPLKYAGLAPWEIFVSESQERMVLAVAPKRQVAALQTSGHRLGLRTPAAGRDGNRR
jgi:phosphoribosylformylglycinamidine synthase